MPDISESNSSETLDALAGKVREASRSGKVLPLHDVWKGNGEDFLEWKQSQTGMDDIALMQENGEFLYSEQHMTRAYAEGAARAVCKDKCYAIAQTVRGESRTYPRPTPLALFGEAPFLFSKDILDEAVKTMLSDPDYGDIRPIQASDGSRFLFSSVHMDPAHAESMAEWMAVGHMQNP